MTLIKRLFGRVAIAAVAVSASALALADTAPAPVDTTGMSTWATWAIAGFGSIFAVKIGPKAAVWGYGLVSSFFSRR